MRGRKNSPEAVKASNERIRALTSHIGPITTKQFAKVQDVLQNYNENVRIEALWNMLVMMKEQNEEVGR